MTLSMPIQPDLRPTPIPGHLERLLAAVADRSEANLADACEAVGAARLSARDSATVDLLASLSDQLESLARIQHILRPPSEPVLDIGEAICELCGLMAEARFASRGVFVRVRAESITLDSRAVWAAVTIVSEIMLHVYRTGFHTPPGIISVDVFSEGGATIVELVDDGTARDLLQGTDAMLSRSLLELTATNIGGTFEFPEATGLPAVRLMIPVDALPARDILWSASASDWHSWRTGREPSFGIGASI